MKRIIFNICFTLSFFLIFAGIVLLYSDHFVQALSANSTELFPESKNLTIAKNQQWTEAVRNFGVNDGEAAKQVTVLMYHRIIDDNDLDDVHFSDDRMLNETIVLKSEFEKQMQLLKDDNYVTLTAKEFQLFMNGELNVPKKSVLITFDDGFKENVVEAYPILKKNNFTAINFLITAAMTEENSKYDAKEFQYFSVPDIESSSDIFEFQSHTYNFHKRTENEVAYLVAKTKEEIKNDLAISLINLEGRNRSFSYPYGEYNEETIKVLKELGFEMAFTVEYDDAEPGMNMFEIPRKGVYPNDTLEDFKKIINLD